MNLKGLKVAKERYKSDKESYLETNWLQEFRVFDGDFSAPEVFDDTYDVKKYISTIGRENVTAVDWYLPYDVDDRGDFIYSYVGDIWNDYYCDFEQHWYEICDRNLGNQRVKLYSEIGIEW